jgi:hypothetical protein
MPLPAVIAYYSFVCYPIFPAIQTSMKERSMVRNEVLLTVGWPEQVLALMGFWQRVVL